MKEDINKFIDHLDNKIDYHERIVKMETKIEGFVKDSEIINMLQSKVAVLEESKVNVLQRLDKHNKESQQRHDKLDKESKARHDKLEISLKEMKEHVDQIISKLDTITGRDSVLKWLVAAVTTSLIANIASIFFK